MRLDSYAQGEWVAGSGKGATLLNAITGEPVAEIGSQGIDFAGMLDYARRKGMSTTEVERWLRPVLAYDPTPVPA